jgi:hypothetical protein
LATSTIGVLVHDGFDGGGLAGPRLAVEEHVVGRQAREEALGVPDERLPLALVGYEIRKAYRVGVEDRLEVSTGPAERPVVPEGAGAVPGEVVREQAHAAAPVLRRGELAGHHVARRRPLATPRATPGEPDPLQPGDGALHHAQQEPCLQVEEALERAEIPARLLRERRAQLAPLRSEAEGVLVVQQAAHEVRPPRVGQKGVPI